MVKKLTLEHCQQTAIERNGKCLSTEYKNKETKMRWQCEEGHKWEATYGCIRNDNTWCPTCYNKRRGNSLKLSIKECQDIAQKKGGKCLSKEYINSSTKIKWQCEEGHEWESKYNDIQQGGWCSECYGNKKHTLDDCQGTAKEKYGKCLSKEYINNKTRMIWQCKEGHEWKAQYYDIIINKSWCPNCAGKAKHTLEKCQQTAKERNGKCLSTEYKNALTKIKWQCKEGHEWEAAYHDVKSKSTWCPHCQIYKHEEECRTIIENIYNKPFPKGKHSFLINPETNQKLELDGYNEELKIAFEYQGIQHYEAVEYFGGEESMLAQQKRDTLKKELCEKHEISLIEIPHWTKDLYEYISQELFDLNVL